ncbi:hypothetical protein COUCH_15765 [Couchioplanes caeruleus]|uniref:LamG-like jellyroll fold domain-containing protein n=1 Tax=Couchioplanes caeruleus TaxID=56438 RepID=UPI0020BD6414|nr:LamG-like jellyroll fold domain-containing protein [Couchioplanes caeruleus]UQU67637.1 hypothetical protein COUCH_15765 [Couchioplanes caeruleus]
MTLPLSADLESVARGATGRMSRRLTQPFAAGGDVLALPLAPVAGTPAAADVAAYDFTDHQARFGAVPVPSYLLRTLGDLERETRVTVRVSDPALPGGGADVPVVLRAGTLAGESVPVPVPAAATGAARLTRITVARRSGSAFVAAPGPAAEQWALSALLGNLARLLWVLGAERDALRRQIARTAAQRRLDHAAGPTLDLIGADLAVPRFPPLPYPVDDDTIALYHLDDAPGAAVGAEDAVGRFPGRTAHPAVLSGSATPGLPGRYGPALTFAGPGAATVATDPAFDLPATASFTAECFVKPDVSTPDSRILSRRGATGPGWTVEVGGFGRGLARAVRATVADDTRELVLHADLTLAGDRFTHLALVVDRAEASAALWVDGIRRDLADATALGALTAAVPLVIGPGAGGLRAVLDEVRLSRVARVEFAPVLGESDGHYRRRLRIFRRWVLPTPAGLAELLNEAVGTIGGVTDPIVVDDADSAVTRGHTLVRVVPAALGPGESIDATGRRGTTEADLYGDPDDRRIDPALLLRHDDPRVDYGPVTSGDPHLMQPPLAADLDRLLDLVGPVPGRLQVTQAWTPDADDARCAGRGLIVAHPGMHAGTLAARAHEAGFTWVRTQPRDAGVYASCPPGSAVVLVAAPPPAEGAEPAVDVGGTLTLTASPVPPPGAELIWSVATGLGPGRVRLTAGGASATVDGVLPGLTVISVDLLHRGFTSTASVAVHVRPATLDAGATIAADGTLGAGPEVAGAPGDPVDPGLLDTVTDARATYASASARRMQRGVSRRLVALLDGLTGVPGALTVVSALVPVAAGAPLTLAAQGRALTLRHSSLAVGALAARAHAAGFAWVSVSGTTVEIRHAAEDLIEVRGPRTVPEDASIDLEVVPDPSTVSATTRLSWSSGSLEPTPGEAGVTTTSLPQVRLIGQRAGRVWVQAAFREAGANGPYAMQIRLRPTVPAGSTISRDQYDLIMNVVHALHPLGVEVLTRAIRPAVVELAGSPSVDPDYTYPKFRLHRSVSRLRKDAEHG